MDQELEAGWVHKVMLAHDYHVASPKTTTRVTAKHLGVSQRTVCVNLKLAEFLLKYPEMQKLPSKKAAVREMGK